MKQTTINIAVEKKKPFEITHLNLQVENLPQSFENYKIVQLTDLHFGICTPASVLEQAFAIVRDIKPSLICLTGDYIQVSATGLLHVLATRVSPKLFRWKQYRRDVRKLAQLLSPMLQTLEPEDGIVGVFGNHDYHEGLGTIKRQFPQNIRWLVNQTIELKKDSDSIFISGIDDHKYGKPDIEKTISKVENTSNFKLLLAHNPDVFLSEQADMLSQYHLTICGHTHGGQICLPNKKPIITRTEQKDHCIGLSYFKDSSSRESAVYVNRGVGRGGIPLRLFCPPEILVITLQSL